MSNQIIKNDDYKKILNFLSLLKENDKNYRHNILNYLSNIFNYKSLTFLLADENEMFIEPLGLNISNKLCKSYSRYYFKTDIFHPINLSTNLMLNKQVLSISDIMSYDQFEETEYYIDFLRKDNLYYEIAVPLSIENKLIGGIGVFRSKEEGCFENKDVEILKCLSTHIAYYINQKNKIVKLKDENFLYKNSTYNLPIGLIIIDENKNIINCNDKAKSICSSLTVAKDNNPVKTILNKIISEIDLSKLNLNSHINSKYGNYIFKITLSRVPNIYDNIEKYFNIYISDENKREISDLTYMSKIYDLSERELEIIKSISKGLTNSEIGKELFISKNTVRTHIDNIFNKLNVNSRIEILNKLGIIDNN